MTTLVRDNTWLVRLGDTARRTVTSETIERLITMGGSRALAAIFGFAATLLIAGALEPAALGLWSMALAVQGLAMHLGEAGLRSVAIVEVAQRPDLARAFLYRIVRLRVLISTAVIAAAGVIAWAFSLGDWRICAIVLTSLWPIALQLDWLPLAQGKNRRAAVLLLARTSAFLALLLSVPLAGDPLLPAFLLVAAWWIAAIVSWPCLALLPRRTKASTSTATDPATPVPLPSDGGLLRLSLPIAAGTFASQILLSLDILVVGIRLGAESAAFYHLASAILVAGLVLANGLGQTVLARMGARASTPAVFREALGADLRLIVGLALIAAVAAASLVPLLLPLAFDAAYAATAGVLFWLLPWFVLTHATIVLQAAMVAGRLGDRLIWATAWMLATLLPSLAIAWWLADLRAFAIARGAAEAVRVLALWWLLPLPLRPFRNDQLA